MNNDENVNHERETLREITSISPRQQSLNFPETNKSGARLAARLLRIEAALSDPNLTFMKSILRLTPQRNAKSENAEGDQA